MNKFQDFLEAIDGHRVNDYVAVANDRNDRVLLHKAQQMGISTYSTRKVEGMSEEKYQAFKKFVENEWKGKTIKNLLEDLFEDRDFYTLNKASRVGLPLPPRSGSYPFQDWETFQWMIQHGVASLYKEDLTNCLDHDIVEGLAYMIKGQHHNYSYDEFLDGAEYFKATKCLQWLKDNEQMFDSRPPPPPVAEVDPTMFLTSLRNRASA
jgi:hypothetical protein